MKMNFRNTTEESIMHSVTQYISHPYVSTFFFSIFLGGYIFSYVIAFFMARFSSSNSLSIRNLVESSYKAWILAFVLHMLIALFVFLFLLYKLWEEKKLSIDWMFLLPMSFLIILDIILLLFLSKKKDNTLALIS